MADLKQFNNSFYYLDYVNHYRAFRRRVKYIPDERKHVDISHGLQLSCVNAFSLPFSDHLFDESRFDYSNSMTTYTNYFQVRGKIYKDHKLMDKYDCDYFHVPYFDSCIHYKEIDKLGLPPVLAGKVLLYCNDLAGVRCLYELSEEDFMSCSCACNVSTLQDLAAHKIAYKMMCNTQIVKERMRVFTCLKNFPEIKPVLQNTFIYDHYVNSQSCTLEHYFNTSYIYNHVEQLYSAINFAVYGKYQPQIYTYEVDDTIIDSSYNHVVLQAALAKFESSKIDLTPTPKTCKVLEETFGRDIKYLFDFARVPHVNARRKIKLLRQAVKQSASLPSTTTGMSIQHISSTLRDIIKTSLISEIEKYLGISIGVITAIAWTQVVSSLVSVLTTAADITSRGSSKYAIVSLVSSIISLIIAIAGIVVVHSTSLSSFVEQCLDDFPPILVDTLTSYLDNKNISSAKSTPDNFVYNTPDLYHEQPEEVFSVDIEQVVSHIPNYSPTVCEEDLIILQSKGDGNCLWHSVFNVLKMRGTSFCQDVIDFKKNIYKTLKSRREVSPAHRKLLLNPGDNEFTKNNWGDTSDLEDLNRLYGITFCVHTKTKEKKYAFLIGDPVADDKIHLLYEDQHYDALIEKGKQQSDLTNNIINFVVSTVGIGLTIAGVAGWKDGISFMKNFNTASTFRKNLTENLSNVRDMVEFVAESAFGCVLSSKTSYIRDVDQMIKVLDNYLLDEIVTFQSDYQQYYDFKAAIVKATTLCTNFRLPANESRLSAANALLLASIARAKNRLNKIAEAIKTNGNRQETLIINIVGEPGAGKSHAIQQYIIPKLCERMGWDLSYYTIEFGGQNAYWPIYNGAHIGLYDEFLALRDEEPLIHHINAIGSQTFFNMPHAEIDYKMQPCNLKVLFTISNSFYMDLRNTLSDKASAAMYSRLNTFEIVNTTRQKDSRREDIQHSANYAELKVKKYTTPMSSNYKNFVEGKDFTECNLDTIVDFAVEKMEKFKDLHELSPKMKPLEVKYTQAVHDNIVFLFSGEPNTGKSELTDYIGKRLAHMTKLPLVVIREGKLMNIPKPTVPAIYVLHDFLSSETDYLHFYDSVTKPSIILNSANMKFQPVRVYSPKHSWNISATSLDFVSNYISDLMNLKTTIIPINQKNMEPGFIRRIGLTGQLLHMGQHAFRAFEDGGHFTAEPGFIFKDEKGEVQTRNRILQRIYDTTNRVLKDQGLLRYEEMLNLEHPTNVTVGVYTENLEQLRNTVNDQSKVIRAWVEGKKNNPKMPYITVSNIVANSTFNFTPSMFYLPTVQTNQDLYELAERAYTTLRSGDPSFDCWIQAGKVSILARDNCIYYNTLEVVNTMCHNIQDDKFVLSELQNGIQSLLVSWDMKGLVHATENGFIGEEYVNVPVTYIQYVQDNYHLISQHQDYQKYLPHVKLQQINASLIKNEHLSFWSSYEVFKKSPIFILIVILLALLSLLLFTRVIQGIIAMVTKDKPTIYRCNYCTKQGEMLQVAAIPTQDLYFDKKTANELNKHFYDMHIGGANLHLYTTEYFDMEAGADMLEIKAILRKAGLDTDMLVNIYVDDDLPDIPWENYTLQGADYTKPVKKMTGKNQVNRKVVRKPVVHIVNARKQSEAVQRHIRQRVVNNLVKVYAYRCANGIGIRNNVILAPAHLFVSDKGEYMEDVRIERNVKGHMQEYTAKLRLIAVEADYAFLTVNDKQFEAFPNISNYFISESETDKVQRAILAVTRNLTLPGFVEKEGKIRLNTLKTGAQSEQAYCVYTFSNWSSNFKTIEGDCGLPYFADEKSLNERICVGFHTAASQYNTEAAYITQELIRDSIILFDASLVKQGAPALKTLEFNNHPDFPDTQIVFNPRYEDLMLNGTTLYNIDKDQLWYQNSPSNKLYPLIYVEKMRPVENAKHEYHKPSYFNDTKIKSLIEDLGITTAPSIVSIAGLDGNSLGELPTLNGKRSLLAQQMSYYNDIIHWDKEQEVIMNLAARYMMPDYIENYGKDHRTLTELETINGLYINARDRLYMGLEAMDMDTSAGFYARVFLNRTKKKDIFSVSDDKTPNGGYLHKWREDEVSMELRKYVQDCEKCAITGIRMFTLAQDNLKMEVTKAGKTRSFVSMDLPETMLVRKWYGTFMAQVKLKHQRMHCQLGIDPVMEFDSLFKRFRRISLIGEAGDFKRWDKHITAPMIKITMQVIQKIILHSLRADQHEHFKQLNKIVTEMIIYTFVIAGNVLYSKTTGNPSGNVLTTPLNSITNDLYHVGYIIWAYRLAIRLYDEPTKFEQIFRVHPSKTQVKNWSNMNSVITSLIKHTDWVNYGDDHAAVVCEDYAWLINFRLKQKYFMEMFNILYDTPEKDGNVYDLIPLTSISFLSRTFKANNSGIIIPYLKKSSVISLLAWTRTNIIEIQYQSFQDALNEAVMHDKDFYDKIVYIIRCIHDFNDTYVKLPPIYDYSVAREMLIENIRHGRGTIAAPFIQKEAKAIISKDNEFQEPLKLPKQSNDIQTDLSISNMNIKSTLYVPLVYKQSTGNDSLTQVLATATSALPETTQLEGSISHINSSNFQQQLYNLDLKEQAFKRYKVRNVNIPVNEVTEDTTIITIPYGDQAWMSPPMIAWANQHSLMNVPICYEFQFITASTIVNALAFGILDSYRTTASTPELQVLEWAATPANSDARKIILRYATPLVSISGTTAVGPMVAGVNPRLAPAIDDMVPTICVNTLTGVQNSFPNNAVDVQIVIYAHFVHEDKTGFRWTQADLRNVASSTTGIESAGLVGTQGTLLSNILRLDPAQPVYPTLDGTIASKFPPIDIVAGYGPGVGEERVATSLMLDDSPTFADSYFSNVTVTSTATTDITIPIISPVSYEYTFISSSTSTPRTIVATPWVFQSILSYGFLPDTNKNQFLLDRLINGFDVDSLVAAIELANMDTSEKNQMQQYWPRLTRTAPTSATGQAVLALANGPPLIGSIPAFRSSANSVPLTTTIIDYIVAQIITQGLQVLVYTVAAAEDLNISFQGYTNSYDDVYNIPNYLEVQSSVVAQNLLASSTFNAISRTIKNSYTPGDMIDLETMNDLQGGTYAGDKRLLVVSDGISVAYYVLGMIYTTSNTQVVGGYPNFLSPNTVNTRFRGYNNVDAIIIPEGEPVSVGAKMFYNMPNSNIVTLLDEQRLTGYLTLPSGYSILEFGNTLPPTLNSTIALSLGRTVPRDPYFNRSWINLLRSMNYSPQNQYVRFTLSNTQNIVPMAQVLYDGENDIFMVGNSPSAAQYSYLAMPKATAEELRISNLQLVARGNPPTSGTNTLNWINRVSDVDNSFFNGQAISKAPKLVGDVIGSRRQFTTGIKISNSVVISTNKQGAALAAAVGGGASGLAGVLQQQAMQESWFQYMSQSQQIQIQAQIDQLAQQFENNKELQNLAQQFQMQYSEAQHKQDLETLEFQSRQQAGYTSLAQHQRNNLKQNVDFQPEADISTDKNIETGENERQGIGLTENVPQTSQSAADSSTTLDPTYSARLKRFNETQNKKQLQKELQQEYSSNFSQLKDIDEKQLQKELQQEYQNNFKQADNINNPVNVSASDAKLYQGRPPTNFQSSSDTRQAKRVTNPIHNTNDTNTTLSRDAVTSATEKKSNVAGGNHLTAFDNMRKNRQGHSFSGFKDQNLLQPTVI